MRRCRKLHLRRLEVPPPASANIPDPLCFSLLPILFSRNVSLLRFLIFSSSLPPLFFVHLLFFFISASSVVFLCVFLSLSIFLFFSSSFYFHAKYSFVFFLPIILPRLLLFFFWGTRQRSWLRHYATSRKVAGSIPD
jgi:hypothetical protein